MKLLLVNALPGEDAAAQTAIEELKKKMPDCTVIHAYEKKTFFCRAASRKPVRAAAVRNTWSRFRLN